MTKCWASSESKLFNNDSIPEIFWILFFLKISTHQKMHEKFPVCKEFRGYAYFLYLIPIQSRAMHGPAGGLN